MKEKRTLEIKIGEEYKAHIENEDQFEKSIFSDLYNKAKSHVDDIIRQSNGSLDKSNPENYNNIIAFTGERGTGKTSAMISFVNSLKTTSYPDQFGEKKTYRFGSLKVIDPSLFRSKDKLFEIIITQMFAKFQDSVKRPKSGKEISSEEKRSLLDTFQKVYSDLQILNKEKKDVYHKDVIEALSDLAYGTNLNNKFKELVDKYLDIIENGADFLVIPIDDFDLNIGGAYDMLEDIRQFLIQRRIIIFIACKIEQLKDSLRQKIVFKSKELFNPAVIHFDGFYTEDQPKEKAERYLEKLFPIDRRLYTESIRIENKVPVKVITDNEKFEERTAEELVIKLIYQKTKLFVPIVNEARNYFVGRTLRQLIHQVALLYELNEIEDYLSYMSRQKNDFLSGNDLIIFDEINGSYIGLNEYYYEWFDQKINDSKDNKRTAIQSEQIISISDVFKAYIKLGESTKQIDFSTQRWRAFLALNYSATNRLQYNQNNLTGMDLMFNFYIENMLFPDEKSTENKGSRDSFSFNGFKDLVDEMDDSNQFQFILCFVSILGREKFLTKTVLSKKIPWKSKTHDIIQFSANNFISALFNRDIQFFELRDELNDQNSLIYQLKNWNFKGIENFSNLFFLLQFKSAYQLAYERLSKDSKLTLTPSPSIDLKIRIIEGYELALETMKEKYPYLEFDISDFMQNPIFKYWNQNEERVNYLLDKILLQYHGEKVNTDFGLSNLALSMLNEYRRYFNNNSPNSQGAKRAMNNLIREFIANQEVFNELKTYRNLMNQNLLLGLSNIQKKLTELITNG